MSESAVHHRLLPRIASRTRGLTRHGHSWMLSRTRSFGHVPLMHIEILHAAHSSR